ncbi:hypothetical protein [Escherichia coli]|uniref:hypothetical protein n=1 Tax=Escherichia coli TaxID=562 RepID=UPI0020405820|nr:hypothetical protein [Escherichia coli]
MTKKTPNDNNKSLFRRERPGDVFVPGPVEDSLVETVGKELYAMAVPHQQFHPRPVFAGK